MGELYNMACLSSDDKDKMIINLIRERDFYKKELEIVRQDKANVMCELNRLKFELQMTELKRLRENDSATKGPYCGQSAKPRIANCNNLNKSSSLENSPPILDTRHPPLQNGIHSFKRSQALSQSSIGTNRHNRGAVDDSGQRGDRWRRNGNAANGQAYELSQDLADKRLEMLERRYGGEMARRAAVVIQRAYRHYAMHKKFRAITATAKAQEKRLSRRFTIESSEWGSEALKSLQDAESTMRTEFDQLHRDSIATVYHEPRRTSRTREIGDYINDSSLYCHQENLLSPVSANVDVNSYASSKEMRFLPSEDSGFGSQDTISSKISQSGRSRHGGTIPAGKKPPPDIPRRSSSMKSTDGSNVDTFAVYSTANHRVQRGPLSLTPPSSTPSSATSEAGSEKTSLKRGGDNGSLSSVQSSGSDSSLSHVTSERGTPISHHDHTQPQETPTSPVWKRKAQIHELEDKRLSNISENSEDSCNSNLSEGVTYTHAMHTARYAHQTTRQSVKVSDVYRKRQYRVGLNLFNKKPERGIAYLISKGFFDDSPQAVAKFMLTRKGLSKQMIGEYLGNLQNPFCMSTLEYFANEIDLSGMQVDVALRKFQTYYRMPGEAQKIERLMQVFAQRYSQCNRDIVAKFRDPETVFVLAFAIIMLNTDLHTAAMKTERRMKMQEFIRNLRGIDDGCDIEREMLEGMYNRIKAQEFESGHDHVAQVLKVQQTIVGKKPVLALPHRRLVCYCRLYEIADVNKKERPGIHQRELFLFNDLLVVTKIMKRNKNSATYTFRDSFALAGLSVVTRESAVYSYLIEIRQRVDNKLLIRFNARNEHDRTKFSGDLKESILEMDEMENLRIEGELERQKANMRTSRPGGTENRDSGVADMELIGPEKNFTLKPEGGLRKTALSNSLLDIHEAGHQVIRRTSASSLDSKLRVRKIYSSLGDIRSALKCRTLNKRKMNTVSEAIQV